MNPKTAMLDVDGTANITGDVSSGGTLAAGNTNITGSTTATTYVGITPDMITLGNVNNSSDALKPISTATNTALNLKADSSSPMFWNSIGITHMVGSAFIDILSGASNALSCINFTKFQSGVVNAFFPGRIKYNMLSNAMKFDTITIHFSPQQLLIRRGIYMRLVKYMRR